MKTILKAAFAMGIVCILSTAYSQGTGAKGAIKKSGGTLGNSVAIELKNLSDKPVTVFVGRMEETKDCKAKQKVYGALSTNTVYASISEVVCIIKGEEEPLSCTEVKPGINEIHVDASGTEISGE